MEQKPTISIDDFHKLEIKIGLILSAEKIENADKLLKLSVDMGLKPHSGSPVENGISDVGERDIRQIVSGIAKYFPDPGVLVGKRVAFAANLEPRTIRGFESQGMILAVSGDEEGNEFFSLLETNSDVAPGSTVK